MDRRECVVFCRRPDLRALREKLIEDLIQEAKKKEEIEPGGGDRECFFKPVLTGQKKCGHAEWQVVREDDVAEDCPLLVIARRTVR